MMIRRSSLAITFALLGLLGSTGNGSTPPRQGPAARLNPTTAERGSTVTHLPDGRVLTIGGEGSESRAVLFDPATGLTSAPANRMLASRAGHTATVLSNGTVLLAGGRNGSLIVDIAEIFDPATDAFSPLAMMPGASARAAHTATLLTDGRVLVAGGQTADGSPLSVEIWDLVSHTVAAVPNSVIDRSWHAATLTAEGRVVISGGITANGQAATTDIRIDPAHEPEPYLGSSADALPTVTALIPKPGSKDVPVDAHLTLRFSDAMSTASMSPETVSLSGPDGAVATRFVSAEDGRLLFVWPTNQFVEGAEYTLRVAGVADRRGIVASPIEATFVTVQRPESATSTDDEWTPDAASLRNGWRTNRPPSPWEQLPALLAPPGVTAISGRVLTLDGRPLPGVALEMEGVGETQSDRSGRFLLRTAGSMSGRHVLEIKGETASRPGRQFGFFEYGMTVTPGQTTVLPFTIWMPRLDTRHTVKIPSPTTREVVVTTPYIPGLELHIPPHTVIRGEDGRAVTELGITPVPVDRPPFPLANVEVPVYFTIQPGGAYVDDWNSGVKGAWLVYPNYRHGVSGQSVQFYHYDPDELGWYVYGLGTVTPNEAQVAPDPATRLYEFTGAMINCCGMSPAATGGTPGGPPRADPVDPSTGVFLMHNTDLYLPDIIPLALTRTYNSGDNLARPFGRGMTHPYAMFLWSALQWQQADLILPEGGKIHYVRTSAGTGFTDAVFEHTTTPTAFYKSTITWNGHGWNLTLKDGTVYVFGEEAPLQSIRDRYGNETRITWSSTNSFGSGLGNITKLTSPNGRWIAFTYDVSNRITQAADNSGRTVSYTYDPNGNLSTVRDPENSVTTYTYDGSNRLVTIRDGRNIVYVTNTYTNGRVTAQTLAAPNATYQFAYTLDGSGTITQTEVTDPCGHVERLAFNADHYITSDIEAYGTGLARTTTITRQAGSNLVTAIVDGLDRRTEFTYDTSGNVLSETRLAATQDAVTTTFTYEPVFSQLASITDPLNHTWTVGYDSAGRMTSTTDPLNHQTTLTMNGSGQLTQVVDSLQHTWHFGYTGGDLTSTTDPMGNVQSQFVDAGGRLISSTDPLQRVTVRGVDKLNRVTTVTDPLGGQTAFSYDANGNLLSLTDALSHSTTYTYNDSDRMDTRADPLSNATSFAYDLKDRLAQVTDRKGQITSYTYDALDRLSQVTYDDQSTVAYTYDAGDRLTQIIDSLNGTITRHYDDLDRPTQEVTGQGTIVYTYDADGRRSTMTVAGQIAVSYEYDDAHRLTSITQGTDVVGLTYDGAGRRSALTYPNGIVGTYGYDASNRLTNLVYTLGQTTLGDLTYSYDGAGNRTSLGGSWARTGLPSALASATYDAANRILTWGGTPLGTDLNGNLTTDGTNSYTWNARNELVGLSGGASASFQYDGMRRRRSKSVGSTTTGYLYDGGNLVYELSGSTTNASLLTSLGVDEYLTRTDANGKRYVLRDALGSTMALADASGSVQTDYTYEPFGSFTTSGNVTGNALTFAGREADTSNLFFNRARYYDSRLQRFLSEDPAGFGAGDTNLQSYVGNAPTIFTDPSGLSRIPFPPDCEPDQIPSKTVMNPFGVTCFSEPTLGVMPLPPSGPLFSPGPGGPGGPPSFGPGPEPPPLKPLHDPSLAPRSTLNFWGSRTTEEIIESLRPGTPEALRVKPDGTVINGNTRIRILQDRGVPVNTLPREPYLPLPPPGGGGVN